MATINRRAKFDAVSVDYDIIILSGHSLHNIANIQNVPTFFREICSRHRSSFFLSPFTT